MRMWMINPKYLCRNHLLGEHKELHMLVGSINKGKNISGYLIKNLVDPSKIIDRHKKIAKEMIKRGYNHLSELPKIKDNDYKSNIEINKNISDLIKRCSECRKNFFNVIMEDI